ncbi:MAG: DUF192 domain-containing protein [Candidatus Aminicenantales bacterium]
MSQAFWIVFLLNSVLISGSRESFPERFIQIYLPNGKAITTELAVTEEERQRGLMFREKIFSDQGMLFVFKEEGFYSFWMKNTWIPLDILWLDKERRIVHIEREVPPCREDPCPSYSSPRAALYVLELESGAAERYQLKFYDRIEFVLPGKKKAHSP